MPDPLILTVNGTTHPVRAAPDTPLLYVLRNELELNGPQFGCGLEQCGACMVLVGAKAMPSCRLPVSEVGRAAVTTLEGLSAGDELHPVQRAFVEEQATQCGYCLNGMIMTTAALLWKTPHPTDDQIRAVLDGNLCRCGAHLRILRAVNRAAGSAIVPARPCANMTFAPGGRADEGRARMTGGFFGKGADQLDSRLRIEPDGTVTAYSGKVELGTGVRTALAQIVAEELDVPLERVRVVMGDTALTPDEGYTAGSMTIRMSGTALRLAAAEARLALLELACDALDAAPGELTVREGVVAVRHDPERSITYAGLMGGKAFNRAITGRAPLKPPEAYTIVGAPAPRVDLPAKVSGKPNFIHDLRLPGMLHARLVRPPGPGAMLVSLDETSVQDVPGLVNVVRQGNFVGVIAEREEQAVRAAAQLRVEWQPAAPLPRMEDLYTSLRSQPPAQDTVLVEAGEVEAALGGADRQLQAVYYQPYHAHASMGPSCAVADAGQDGVTIWCSTQGPYPLRGALAQLLEVPPEQVHVIHVEGAGCYGQNGADDAAAEAALLSRAVGRPVRLLWSREDEFVWEPKAAAMVMEVRGGLDAEGGIAAWDYGVWSPTHAARPRFADQLLAAQWRAGRLPPAPRFFLGAERNAPAPYRVPHRRVSVHWLAASPLRVSSFRTLGGAANTFANESFVDELAALAGADPIEFRLRHLDDPRARDVLAAAAKAAGWAARPSPRARGAGAVVEGRGAAFAQYENTEAYVAMVAQVRVAPGTGAVQVTRIVVAHDCGLIINPDGLRNQIEGNVLQSLSRALKEEVRFDGRRVTGVDWQSYPILTFSEVPPVDIVLLNRPDQPAVGAGEPATVTTAAAVANAIFDATGARVRQVPFTPERVRVAIRSSGQS